MGRLIASLSPFWTSKFLEEEIRSAYTFIWCLIAQNCLQRDTQVIMGWWSWIQSNCAGASAEATGALVGMDSTISPMLAVFLRRRRAICLHCLDSDSWFALSLFPFFLLPFCTCPFYRESSIKLSYLAWLSLVNHTLEKVLLIYCIIQIYILYTRPVQHPAFTGSMYVQTLCSSSDLHIS